MHIEKGNQYINGANQNKLGENPNAPKPASVTPSTNAAQQKMTPQAVEAERAQVKAALKANPNLNYQSVMDRFKKRTGQDL